MDETAILNELSIPKDAWFLRNLPFNQLAQRLTPNNGSCAKRRLSPTVFEYLRQLHQGIPKYRLMKTKTRSMKRSICMRKLKAWQKQKELYRIFTQLIPYPLVIIFHQGEKWNGQLQSITGMRMA